MSIDLKTAPSETFGPRANNALKFGLFSTRDLVLVNEQSEYEKTREAFMNELNPYGELEQTFAYQIVSDTWRMRRCGLIEASLVHHMSPDEYGFPLLDAEGEKRQKSADRARAQAQTSLRRSMAELRKLQTERQIRVDIGRKDDPHIMVDNRAVIGVLKTWDKLKVEAMIESAPAPQTPQAPKPAPKPETLICKPTPSYPRNNPCPCGSGVKYKRCCYRVGEGWPALSPHNVSKDAKLIVDPIVAALKPAA